MLRRLLGESGSSFLEFGLGRLTKMLPHVETLDWTLAEKPGKPTGATFAAADKRQLRLVLTLKIEAQTFCITGLLQRRKTGSGVGSISRTLDSRERDLAQLLLRLLRSILSSSSRAEPASLVALKATLEERVVAQHLQAAHGLTLDLSEWFRTLRRLAEQTYENRALTLGCLLKSNDHSAPAEGASFPSDFLGMKRYRALSDGYRTAYVVSSKGMLIGFVDLSLARKGRPRDRYYPEWCEDIALMTSGRGTSMAIVLTRQGDIVVLEAGRLTFTYRFGQWQYWNHNHIVDLMRNAARVQHVAPRLVSQVVRAIYRAALDVSFRRSGGLFVLLKKSKNLRSIVRKGDAILDSNRENRDEMFDSALTAQTMQGMPRSVVSELAGLDGALVLTSNGKLLAYGAILDPKKKGRIARAEGSRTKAALASSNYGLALKVSSDGDMTVFFSGKELVRV